MSNSRQVLIKDRNWLWLIVGITSSYLTFHLLTITALVVLSFYAIYHKMKKNRCQLFSLYWNFEISDFHSLHIQI
jgi:hypothetical protein